MTLCVSSETLLGVVALPAHLGSPASLLGPSPPGRASLRGPGLLTAALHPSETQTTPSFEWNNWPPRLAKMRTGSERGQFYSKGLMGSRRGNKKFQLLKKKAIHWLLPNKQTILWTREQSPNGVRLELDLKESHVFGALLALCSPILPLLFSGSPGLSCWGPAKEWARLIWHGPFSGYGDLRVEWGPLRISEGRIPGRESPRNLSYHKGSPKSKTCLHYQLSTFYGL